MDAHHVIPEEEPPKYRRWELDSFDSPYEPNSGKNQESPESGELSRENEVKLPTEEEIEGIRQQAKEEGYTAGFATGHSTGHQEGKQTAEVQVKTEVARIRVLISELGKELQDIDQQVAHDLLNLALDLAKKMTTQALKIHPELILPIVQEATRRLPHSMQHPRLILHPDDAALIRNHLNDQLLQSNWEIHEDEQMEKGGCRLETRDGEVDASLSTRWQRILATIGQDNNWLA